MGIGGQVARNLLHFYEQLRANLWRAQLTISKPILLQQITDLLTLREAWIEVDHTESGSPSPTPPRTPQVVSKGGAEIRSDWKA